MAGAARAELEWALERRGGPMPPTIEWHESLVSTNDRLKGLARGGAAEWTVVAADRQTGGRGREGRAWISPAGGLYLSVLLRPRRGMAARLPLAAGVAVAEAVEEYGVRAELKWPNDVLLKGRKLAGILAEAASSPDEVEWVVLGIGVNLALDPGTMPEELRGFAASLAAETGRAPRPTTVAAAVLSRLAVWYDALEASPTRVVAAWSECAVAGWGQRVDVRVGTGAVSGRLVGIDEEGALILVTDEGQMRRVLSGEVVRVRRAE
jgi:BirA family transcriptional regulator, biotin operon repressor / biotin---[acetyl-CoA-carboxylase] ligase